MFYVYVSCFRATARVVNGTVTEIKNSCALKITYSSASTKTANSHIKDNNKLHIRPDTHAVYAASPWSKTEN